MKISQFQGSYRWLSNFWKCHIVYDGIEYPSTEHAYQAFKFPIEHRNQFSMANTLTALQAKNLGRQGPILLSLENRLKLMLEVNRLKFNKNYNPDLFEKMRNLPPETILEEGNYWGDEFWGINLKTGVGENHLGKILMSIHAEVLLQ